MIFYPIFFTSSICFLYNVLCHIFKSVESISYDMKAIYPTGRYVLTLFPDFFGGFLGNGAFFWRVLIRSVEEEIMKMKKDLNIYKKFNIIFIQHF